MNNSFLHKKQELLNWIISLEDEEMIMKLFDFKEFNQFSNMVSEPKVEYNHVKDDFDERFAKGLTLEESRKRTEEFIDSLPWKK